MSLKQPVTPLTPEQEAAHKARVAKEGYASRVAIAADDLGAAILGDKNDETMSSMAARAAVEDTGVKQEVGKVVSAGLDLVQADHGAKAIAGDEERAAEVIALEQASQLR